MNSCYTKFTLDQFYVRQISSKTGRALPLQTKVFLSDPGVPSIGPNLCHSLSEKGFANLTDVTLAEKHTNSIVTDNVHRAFQGNVLRKDLVVNFGTNT